MAKSATNSSLQFNGMTNRELARLLRRTVPSVQGMRVRLKIVAYGYTLPRKWSPEEIKLLGKSPDREVAGVLGCSAQAVATKRKSLGIPYHSPFVKKWTAAEEALLGRHSDDEVARRTGRTVVGIKLRRSRKHIRLTLSSRRSPGKPASVKSIAVRPVKSPSETRLFQPWTEEEIKWLGTDTDKVIARKIGRSAAAVEAMRLKKKIPLLKSDVRPWTPEEDRYVGTALDKDIAALLKRSLIAVKKRRIKLGRAAPVFLRPRPKSAHHHLLGVLPDSEIMKLSGRSRASIKSERRRFGIAPAPAARFWKPNELALLGTIPDSEVAAKLRRTIQSVCSKREYLKIPVYCVSLR